MMSLMAFVSYYVEGIASLSVGCIGLVSLSKSLKNMNLNLIDLFVKFQIINAAAIVMLLRQKNSGSIFLKLMISLATYDLIYVFLSSVCFSLPRLSEYFKGELFIDFGIVRLARLTH